ncbi:putative bifunctional diguanylate cyclase/phosphodiesterase [Lichenicola sp.]|uniref:putative bifunctional diguanylate cyclase/phosphodiesterase n=1 Tax=Lichenicola sp. TaxID=2804529 RepID=UPI003B0057DF
MRLQALSACGRTWLVLAPVSILLAVFDDLLQGSARPGTSAAALEVPLACLVVLHALTAWLSLHERARAPHPATVDYRYGCAILMAGLLGSLWAVVLAATSPGPSPVFQMILVPTLILGGILLAPVRAAALLYVGAVAGGAVLAMRGWAAETMWPPLGPLAGGLIAAGAIAWQHAEFERTTRRESGLAEQTEISSTLLHELEEQGSEWLWETGADFHLVTPSPRLCRLLGCRSRTLANLSLRRWINSRMWLALDGRDGFEALAMSLDSRSAFRQVQIPVGIGESEHWLLLSGRPMLNIDGSFRGYRGVGSDITGIRQSERRIAWLARHDSLTGLPNRAHFHEALRTACALQAESGEKLALLCLDLDGFKAINDTLGHLAGDALLTQVAARLRSCIRKRDLIGRLGGDEFAVALMDSDSAAAGELGRRLMAQVTEPYTINGIPVRVGLSIGVILSPDDATGHRDLLKGADLAMYRAKAEGRGTISFFDNDIENGAQNRLLLQADLRHAISRDEISLHFQPIMHGVTGRVVAAEALARWMHPTRGMIPPAEFIPLAEECGLIGALGTWVLRRACLEATCWSEEIGISVNLSPIQLRDPRLFSIVESALQESGLAAGRLELEITESLFLETNPLVRETMLRLKQHGIRFALDDFGTGFSSLSYLRQFHVDTVKIDRSFVRDLGTDLEADMIVQAITGMARGLGITITAEGVETFDQADRLRASGCTQFQGFLYSRPCSADAVRRFMALQHTRNDASEERLEVRSPMAGS